MAWNSSSFSREVSFSDSRLSSRPESVEAP
jgi:hypothetical protein